MSQLFYIRITRACVTCPSAKCVTNAFKHKLTLCIKNIQQLSLVEKCWWTWPLVDLNWSLTSKLSCGVLTNKYKMWVKVKFLNAKYIFSIKLETQYFYNNFIIMMKCQDVNDK